MRKFLQNPKVVSALCGVAALAVGANFLPSRTPTVASARTPNAAPPAVAVSVPPASTPVATAAAFEKRSSGPSGLQEWRDLFPESGLRDPFGLRLPTIQTSPGTLAVTNFPTFRLQAVSIEPGRAYVVINHRVLGLGEQLDDYRVERIESREVWLTGPAGRLVVALTPAPRTFPQKAP